jgi:hypothetical protein
MTSATTDTALPAHDFVTAEVYGRPITFDFSDPRGMTLKWPWPLAIIGRKHMRDVPLKTVENRPQAWRKGTYFLHAGQGVDDAGIMWLRELGADVPDEPLFTGIFAVANIASVCSASVGLRRLFCLCGMFAAAGQHHHDLDVFPLGRTVAHRGSQGPWKVSPDKAAAVRAQVEPKDGTDG